MYTLLRRSSASIVARSPSTTALARSVALSTSSIKLHSASLSERLRLRRQGSERNTHDSDSERRCTETAHSGLTTRTGSNDKLPHTGNLPRELGELTRRAIEADPVNEDHKRQARRKEEQRVARLRRERKENAKRLIGLKTAATDRGAVAREDREGKAAEDGQMPADLTSNDPSREGVRRRMGFTNQGRSKRDHKKALRSARLAAGGQLTQGEQEKLSLLQAELEQLEQKRKRLVPWEMLSSRGQRMQMYKVARRMKRDEDSAKARLGRSNEPASSTSASTNTADAPPSASFDDSLSSAISADEGPQRAVNPSPYSPSTAPPPVIPSQSQVEKSTHPSPLSPPKPARPKAALAKVIKREHAEAARKAWTTRRSTIDREIRDVEHAIAGYLPPSRHLPAKEGISGPAAPKPKKKSPSSLMSRFVDDFKTNEDGTGKDQGRENKKGVSRVEHETDRTEEAESSLPIQAAEDASGHEDIHERDRRKARHAEKREDPVELQREESRERRGRITPRMEREERLRIARSRPYRDHPALQPSSSSSNEPTSSPRELSSYSNVLSPSSVPFAPTPSPFPPVPVAELSHSLARALFNPGVHFLKDPRTGVYNFSPEILENVPKLSEFEFGKLPQYVTSSKDETLKQVAKREGKLFSGSTSSTVGMLCQIYFWMSKGKGVNTSMLSEPWAEKDRTFSMGQQLPVSVVLNYSKEDGTYSIDADKSFDATSESNVLAGYGHLMEKLLTTDPKEFKRFLVGAEDPAPSEADQRQAYHYATTESMVLRSQLDAVHEYLPGNGTFDLKTRGTVAIRQDRMNYEESAGYKIDRLRGPWESFEREYYDLIRSAFLKYQFQARIGCMDGIFVAYHSTARFYGFQYLPISEMDEALFENHETGKQVFKLAIGLLERLLKEAADCFEGEDVNVTFAADTTRDVLRLFVTPQRAIALKETDGAGTSEVAVETTRPMTLLEVEGTNYLNGEAELGPVVVQPTSEGEVPVWQIGYEIKKSTGRQDDVVYDRSSPTIPSITTKEINELFQQVRETQMMFSSMMLPTGVTLKDIKEATNRAKESGVELDPSDLSIRFPLDQGVDYRGPSKQAKALRSMSRKGAERTELEEKEREGEKIIVVKSSFEVSE